MSRGAFTSQRGIKFGRSPGHRVLEYNINSFEQNDVVDVYYNPSQKTVTVFNRTRGTISRAKIASHPLHSMSFGVCMTNEGDRVRIQSASSFMF